MSSAEYSLRRKNLGIPRFFVIYDRCRLFETKVFAEKWIYAYNKKVGEMSEKVSLPITILVPVAQQDRATVS